MNDTTNVKDRNKLQNKGSKGLATTTQLYTVKMIFSQLAKTGLLGKLAAKPVERN